MRPLKLVVSNQAANDLTDIWTYIAENNPQQADLFIDRIHEQCRLIAETPHIGRERLELSTGLRSHPVGRYLIFYRITEEAMEIVRILSGYRDLDVLF